MPAGAQAPLEKALDLAKVVNQVRRGGIYMPAFFNTLSPDEIGDVSAYVTLELAH